MRVIDHRNFEGKQKSGRKYKKPLVLFVVVAVVVSCGFYAGQNNSPKPTAHTPQVQAPGVNSQTQPDNNVTKTKLKEFTPEQFRDLYKTFVFPNTQKISETTPITASEDLDSRIRTLAQAKGYVIRSAPIVDNFVVVDGEHKLQQKASADWAEMLSAATKDGIGIKITAGYRSSEDQKEIFLGRLGSLYSSSDTQINYVLTTTAPPGYSRHHTGYTIDLTCVGYSGYKFENTPCFTWLSKNNYENTKKFGWIPSYPVGAVGQGPEPESWEYVWVSKDSTHQ
ncbi:MAG: M15 family metallopeptidase [Patescibacteria group bacterium]